MSPVIMVFSVDELQCVRGSLGCFFAVWSSLYVFVHASSTYTFFLNSSDPKRIQARTCFCITKAQANTFGPLACKFLFLVVKGLPLITVPLSTLIFRTLSQHRYFRPSQYFQLILSQFLFTECALCRHVAKIFFTCWFRFLFSKDEMTRLVCCIQICAQLDW